MLGTSLPVWRLTTTTPSGSKRKEGRIRTCSNNHTLLAQIGLSRTSPGYRSTRTTQSRLNRIANITTSVRPAIVRVLLNSKLVASVSGSDKNEPFITVILENLTCKYLYGTLIIKFSTNRTTHAYTQTCDDQTLRDVWPLYAILYTFSKRRVDKKNP